MFLECQKKNNNNECLFQRSYLYGYKKADQIRDGKKLSEKKW